MLESRFKKSFKTNLTKKCIASYTNWSCKSGSWIHILFKIRAPIKQITFTWSGEKTNVKKKQSLVRTNKWELWALHLVQRTQTDYYHLKSGLPARWALLLLRLPPANNWKMIFIKKKWWIHMYYCKGMILCMSHCHVLYNLLEIKLQSYKPH